VAAAELAVKVATHELEVARAALGQVTGGRSREQFPVTSPIRGQVLEVLQQSAGVVQPGNPLVSVGDPRALEVVVDVLTRDAVLIQPGAAVTLERWGGQDLSGRVRLVEPAAFTRISSLGVEEQRVNVIIDITSPIEQWQSLGDGYRVEARIVVWHGEGVLTVPASAVFRSSEGWAAFTIDDERAALRPVSIGQRTPTTVQISGGLDEGAPIIVHPSDQVQDGARVTARENADAR
jgi:HlyD family secretion protein